MVAPCLQSGSSKPRRKWLCPAFKSSYLASFSGRWTTAIGFRSPPNWGIFWRPQSPDCILAKERPGCLSLWSAPVWQAKLDEGVDWSSRRCERASFRNASAKCSSSAGCFPLGTRRATGRPRTAGDSRGISRVPRSRAGRRRADCRGGRVRRNLEPGGVAEISRRPNASIPPPVRPVIAIEQITCGHFHARSGGIPIIVTRRCHTGGSCKSREGWAFVRTHDASTHLIPDRAWIFLQGAGGGREARERRDLGLLLCCLALVDRDIGHTQFVQRASKSSFSCGVRLPSVFCSSIASMSIECLA